MAQPIPVCGDEACPRRMFGTKRQNLTLDLSKNHEKFAGTVEAKENPRQRLLQIGPSG
jgi:hypothetical protein